MSKTKRLVIIFVSIIVVLSSVIGVLSYKLWQQKDTSAPTENGENSTTENSPVTEEAEIFSLDTEYKKAFDAAYSNVEKCQVNDNYSDKWDKFAEEYYNKLLEIASDDFKASLIASQTEWEKYAELEEDTQLKYYQNVFGAGTAVPGALSKYKYNLHRERAVELYKMYMELKPLYDIEQELLQGRPSKAEFEKLSIGQSLEDVKELDPKGFYIWTETGRNDTPKISTHDTCDGYEITIQYNEDNTITNIDISET